MSQFSVQIDKTQLARVENTLRFVGNESSVALSRAINRTIDGVRTDATDIIAEAVSLPKTFIRSGGSKAGEKTFHIVRATPQAPTGSIRTQGANVPLIQYSNQRGVKKAYAKRIVVEVKRDQGKHTMRHVFIPVLRSGHRGLFQVVQGQTAVTGRPRIKELYGPRIPDILSNTANFDKLMQAAQDRLDARLAHEIDYILEQGGKQ